MRVQKGVPANAQFTNPAGGARLRPMQRRFFRTILAALFSASVTQLSAQSYLQEGNSPSFGANSVTDDSRTGLIWLDMPFSAGLSYDQALADTAPGGIFYGYRFATVQEVLGLYYSAGIPATGYYSLSTPAIQNLISLIGPSGTINGYQGILRCPGPLQMAARIMHPRFMQSGVTVRERTLKLIGLTMEAFNQGAQFTALEPAIPNWPIGWSRFQNRVPMRSQSWDCSASR